MIPVRRGHPRAVVSTRRRPSAPKPPATSKRRPPETLQSAEVQREAYARGVADAVDPTPRVNFMSEAMGGVGRLSLYVATRYPLIIRGNLNS